MSEKITPYAIVFYGTHIDFFELKQEGYWALKDRFETEFLDDSEIAPKFSQVSLDWQITSKEVSCWLPDYLFQKFMLEHPISNEQILRDYQQDTGRLNDEIVALTREIPSRPGSVQCVALKKNDFDETVVFLRANGFEVVSMAISPGTDSFPSPQIYKIETLRDIAPSDIVQAPIDAKQAAAVSSQTAGAQAITASSHEKSNKNSASSSATIGDKTSIHSNPKTVTAAQTSQIDSKNKKRLVLGFSAIALALIAIASSLMFLENERDETPLENLPSNSNVSSKKGEASGDGEDLSLVENEDSSQITEELPSASTDPSTELPSPIGFDDNGPATSENVDQINVPETGDSSESQNSASSSVDLEPSPFEVDIANIRSSNSSPSQANQSGVVIVESAPSFATPSRPSDQDSVSLESSKTIIETPPARNSTEIQIAAKKIETQAARNPTANSQNGNFRDTIALNEISLLGIFGQTNKPSAMIRSSGGRVKTVNVGETVDGWSIVAISRNEVIVKKGSSQLRLQVPN